MAVGNVVCRSRVLVFDHCRIFSFPTYSHIFRNNEERIWRRLRHCRHQSTIDSPTIEHKQEVVVEYRKGLPTLRVPLPTSRRPCLFIVRPVANTVQDLLDMIKNQDQAIQDLSFSDKDDCLIATSNRVENLLEDDFKLNLNGQVFYVKVPLKEDMNKKTPDKRKQILESFYEDMERLGEIKALVHTLYTSLNVEDHMAEREKEILEQVDEIKIKLQPLEKKKDELDALAIRRTNALTWVGLGLMSVQFGILARLTWWEYSWDIMEPVTYFVTYGTAMAAYAYFVLTKQEYLLPDVRDRQHLITVHKRAAKVGLDLNEYNRLKARLFLLETHLNRMKESHLPAPLPAYSHTPQRHSFSFASWLRNFSRK